MAGCTSVRVEAEKRRVAAIARLDVAVDVEQSGDAEVARDANRESGRADRVAQLDNVDLGSLDSILDRLHRYRVERGEFGSTSTLGGALA